MRKFRAKMIRIFYLFFTVILFGCTSSYNSDYQPEPYLKYVHELVETHADETKKSQGLDLEGSGGAFMGDVKLFKFFYNSHKCVTIDEARRIYVIVTQNFLEMLNSHERIRPYLQKYPADLDNIRILISFAKCKIGSSEVEIVHLNGNNIEYIQQIAPFENKVIYQEPYEKALKIVQCENEGWK